MPPQVEVTIDWDVPATAQLVGEPRATSLLEHALGEEDRTGSWDFAIRFVDDSEMSQLHEAYLNDPSPTDIMTFPYDEDDGEQGGDILISVDSAADNARDHGWSTDDELRFLMLHGLLHILGWDDHGPGARKAMLDRQHELLSTWREEGGVDR